MFMNTKNRKKKKEYALCSQRLDLKSSIKQVALQILFFYLLHMNIYKATVQKEIIKAIYKNSKCIK